MFLEIWWHVRDEKRRSGRIGIKKFFSFLFKHCLFPMHHLHFSKTTFPILLLASIINLVSRLLLSRKTSPCWILTVVNRENGRLTVSRDDVHVAILKWHVNFRTCVIGCRQCARIYARKERKKGWNGRETWLERTKRNQYHYSLLSLFTIQNSIIAHCTLFVRSLCIYMHTYTTIYAAKREKAGKNCQG